MSKLDEKTLRVIAERQKHYIRVTNIDSNESVEFDTFAEAEHHFNLKNRYLKIKGHLSIGESYLTKDGKYSITKLSDRTINDDVREAVISFYKSEPMGINKIVETFKISTLSAFRILKDVPKYSKTLVFNPNLKENYFENIDTQEKAYFLGLIIADGNIFDPTNSSHHGSMWTSITLDEADVYILEKFREEVGLSSVIGSDGRGARYVAVRSDKMAKDLSKYHIVPRKSFITQFPFNVSEDMYRHIIRGIFDGDGSINFKENIISKRDGRCRCRHRMSFCGSHRLMMEISDIINNNLIIEKSSKVYDYKNRTLSEISYASIHDMRNFGLWIYDDATIFMKRKREKFDKFMEHYKLSYDISNTNDYSVYDTCVKRKSVL